MFLKLVLFCLCLWHLVAVFGMVFVNEGDSVTLNSGLTEIKYNDQIQWTFDQKFISIAKKNKQTDRITVYNGPDGIFRDRLKVDHQTGSLTITNTRSRHSGLYTLLVNGQVRNPVRLFVHPKPMSVTEGESATLESDLTQMKVDDVIHWWFEEYLLANVTANIFTVYDDVLDGIFRDRLKLDHQTGSLTITNTRTEHAGLYKLQTYGSKYSIKIFRFSVYARLPVPVISSNSSQCVSSSSCSLLCSAVNVSHVTLSWYKGNSLLSSTSVSDLSVSLSLPLEVEYQDKNTYSCVINNPIRNQTQHLDITQLCHTCAGLFGVDLKDERVLVKEGDSVTLNSGLAELKAYDVIEWMFRNGNTLIAKINNWENSVALYSGPDGRFRGKLNVDYQTGSLTITNARQEHTGLYILGISNVRKRFQVTVIDEISVKEGDSVTLNSGLNEMKDDLIEWSFGNSLIAEIKTLPGSITIYGGLYGKLRHRLNVDYQTGSLTITNITNEQTGFYFIKINDVKKRFLLVVHDEISVMEGDSVTLNSGLTEIKDDEFKWLFITKKTEVLADRDTQYEYAANGRFRDRLKLDNQTGSLTIMNTRTEHAGHYKLKTNSVFRSFNLTVYARLPVTVISTDCPSSSSVLNAGHVTLSWFKGNSLLQWISSFFTPN